MVKRGILGVSVIIACTILSLMSGIYMGHAESGSIESVEAPTVISVDESLTPSESGSQISSDIFPGESGESLLTGSVTENTVSPEVMSGNTGTSEQVSQTSDNVQTLISESRAKPAVQELISANVPTLANTTLGTCIGMENICIGEYALLSNTTGFSNVAIGGKGALQLNTTGYANIAIGNSALIHNTTGYSNVANGFNSLSTNTTGNYNVANGHLALFWNSTGNNNVANGNESLYSNSSGDFNIGIGHSAGRNITTGSNNIAIGEYSIVFSGAMDNQLSIGNWIYGVSGNIGIGVINPTTKLDIDGQIRIRGGEAGSGKVLVSDANGLASWITLPTIPSFSTTQLCIGTGTGNICNGSGTLSANTNGWGNIAIGQKSLMSNTIGNSNIALGEGSLQGNQSGVRNNAFGVYSLHSNTIGYDNASYGSLSLYSNTVGANNTALGNASLYSNTTGYNNTSIGSNSLQSNTSGNGNVANGINALYLNTKGNVNIGIGYNAGKNITIGSNNIAIGNESQVFSGTQDNQLSLGNLIYGIGMTGNGVGNVGIGVANPTTKLDIDGQIRIRGGSVGSGKVLTSDANGLASWMTLPTVNTGTNLPSGVRGNILTHDGSRWIASGEVSIIGNSIGIGTSSPRGLFDVRGGIANSSTSGKSIYLTAESASSGNSSGGTIFLNPGTKSGTGVAGIVAIGMTEAEINAAPWLGNNALYSKGYGYFQGGYIAGNNYGLQWGTSSTRFRGSGNNNSTDYISLITNNTERFRISGSGNIGIGTNNPTQLLTLSGGTIQIINGSQGSGKVLMSDASGIAKWQTIAPVTYYITTSSQACTGTGNVCYGRVTLFQNTKGVQNTGIGDFALGVNMAGSNNTALGYGALTKNIAGNQNIGIGKYAGETITTGSNNIVIGTNISVPNPAGSNQLNIGNWIQGNNGNIAIGTGAWFSERLMVDGNMRVNGTVIATAVNQLSDRSLKTDISRLSSPLSRVLELNGYSFTWKSNGKKDIGLIAQEVEKVYPEVVATDSTTGLKSVEYANLVAPMIEAMKEQQEMIEKQQQEIEYLRTLEKRLEALEAKQY